jgi:hypothetical protein
VSLVAVICRRLLPSAAFSCLKKMMSAVDSIAAGDSFSRGRRPLSPTAAAADGTTTAAAAATAALTATPLPLTTQQQQQQQQQQRQQSSRQAIWATTTAQTIMLGRDGEDYRVTTTTTSPRAWHKEKKNATASSSTATTTSWFGRSLLAPFRTSIKNSSHDHDRRHSPNGQQEASGDENDAANNNTEEEHKHEHYRPLEDCGSTHGSMPSQQKRIKKKQKKGSLLEQDGGHGNADHEFAAGTRSSSRILLTAEDALERNCSFFYRQEEDDQLQQQGESCDNDRLEINPSVSPRRSRHRFRTLRRQQDDPFHPRHAFLYQDAVDVLSPSVLQEYKTRYKQLNQAEVVLDNDYAEDPFEDDAVDDMNHHHDRRTTAAMIAALSSHALQLEEHDHDTVYTSMTTTSIRTAASTSNNGSSSIVRSDTAFHSSLCYLHHGRLLMRLPNDQVRLVMDPDLEAGILSVEQWRREEKKSSSANMSQKQRGDFSSTETIEEQEPEELPPLRYVLTVPMDLYQKLVKEMSHGITSRSSTSSSTCWLSAAFLSCFRCNIQYKHGDEKMDIRIAVWILATVLIVLFVNTVVLGAVQ